MEFHFGEFFPRVGFIVTNLETDSRAVVRFYNKRGTAEQWIKEGKLAVKMTRLSCHRFRSNEVRLWLSVIAYNLGNLWQRWAVPRRIGKWTLTSLQQRLVKHARYYWLLLAESHLTRRLFGSMLRRIAALAVPAGVALSRWQVKNLVKKGGRDGKVSEESAGDETAPGFRLPGRGRTDSFAGCRSRSGWIGMRPPQHKRFGVHLLLAGKAKWKCRLEVVRWKMP